MTSFRDLCEELIRVIDAGNPKAEEHTLCRIRAALKVSRQSREENDAMMARWPSDGGLEIFWRVAVTSAIEGQGEPWQIYARMIYHHIAGTYDHLTLGEK